mmetsp:Transcript_98094/g.155123  ORF Transcript_98094/g.155123 Transcript_98094/m.155123 type:complete len:204 (-) Transcript_98094:127-738(-)
MLYPSVMQIVFLRIRVTASLLPKKRQAAIKHRGLPKWRSMSLAYSFHSCNAILPSKFRSAAWKSNRKSPSTPISASKREDKAANSAGVIKPFEFPSTASKMAIHQGRRPMRSLPKSTRSKWCFCWVATATCMMGRCFVPTGQRCRLIPLARGGKGKEAAKSRSRHTLFGSERSLKLLDDCGRILNRADVLNVEMPLRVDGCSC